MKLKYVMVSIGVLAVTLVSGCGKNLNGNYSGYDSVVATNTATTSNISTAGAASEAENNQMTMSLQDNGNTVTGNWQDQTGSGTLQGTINGGQLSNVILLKSSTSGLTQSVGTYNLDYGCTSYSGNLSIGNDNELTGSLTANAVSTYGSSQCAGFTRTFNLTHSN
jgi:hypothetical protein